MKNAIKSAQVYSLLLFFGFLLSNGVETPMRDGKVLSAMGSRLVGTGINVFFILTIIAVGLMVFPGTKKYLKNKWLKEKLQKLMQDQWRILPFYFDFLSSNYDY